MALFKIKDKEIINRVKRTAMCKNRHFFSYVLAHTKPERFYDCPTTITRIWYLSRIGCIPHLKNPRDFNEQLISINLKAYFSKEERRIRVRCADKYEVRSYVEERGLGSILNDCYGVYDSIEDINIELLPKQFVLKLTNGCGQNYICKDKDNLDKEQLKHVLNGWLKNSSKYGLKSGEWHYAAIKPRIIAEKYLFSLGENLSLVDYKFHCIHGKVVGVLVCYDRTPETHYVNLDYYDTNWNLTDGIYPHAHIHQRLIDKPKSFDDMLLIAETISKGIDYVRVDMYEVGNKPIFGEMTFTPAGNIMTNYKPWLLKELLTRYNE